MALQTNSCAQRATMNTSERTLSATITEFVVMWLLMRYVAIDVFNYPSLNMHV